MKSFVKNAEQTHFPIQNLPYGVFHRKTDTHARIGTAIGNYVLDLDVLEKAGLIRSHIPELFNRDSLNFFCFTRSCHMVSSQTKNTITVKY